MLGCQGIGVVEAGMIMKALSHRKVGDHVDTQRLQVSGRANARTQQDRWATVAAAGEDHLISPVGRAVIGDHAHGGGALLSSTRSTLTSPRMRRFRRWR